MVYTHFFSNMFPPCHTCILFLSTIKYVSSQCCQTNVALLTLCRICGHFVGDKQKKSKQSAFFITTYTTRQPHTISHTISLPTHPWSLNQHKKQTTTNKKPCLQSHIIRTFGIYSSSHCSYLLTSYQM